MGRVKQEDFNPGQPGKKVRPYIQNNQSKKGWRHEAVEHLPSKCEAPSSNPNATKNKITKAKRTGGMA
jgi:hypothetical protein